MTLTTYFNEKKGTGILSTANKEGVVSSAIYARPHLMEDGTLAFVMANRRTHENLQSNAHAAYLFIEEGHGYQGKRLQLTKVKEERDAEKIETLRRRFYAPDAEDRMKPLSLVYFKVDKELPLVGAL